MKTFFKGFSAFILIVVGSIAFWYGFVPILHDWALASERNWMIFLGVCVLIFACVVGGYAVQIDNTFKPDKGAKQ